MVMASRTSKFLSFTVIFMALLTASTLAPFAEPAHAAGGSRKAEKEANRAVEMNAIVFPVVVDGKLVNYLFINSRLIVADGKSTWKYREQAHIIRDALLRATHRESVHLEGYPGRLDQAKAERVCVEAANEIVGEDDAFVGMTFQQVASQKAF